MVNSAYGWVSCGDHDPGDLSDPGNPPSSTRNCFTPGGWGIDFLQYVNDNVDRFFIYQRTIHNRPITVAIQKDYPLLEEERQELSEYVFRTWAVFWKEFGGFPFPSWTLVIGEGVPFNDGGGFPCGTASASKQFDPNWAIHEIFHAWNGNAHRQDGDRMWFVEGATVYFENREGISRTDGDKAILSYAYQLWLDYYNTGKDVPLDSLQMGQPGYDHYLAGFKGQYVAYMLDIDLRKTGHHLGEVVKLVYQRFGILSQGQPTTAQILSIVNEVSGGDFQEFFNKYIYGTEKLPSYAPYDWVCHKIPSYYEVTPGLGTVGTQFVIVGSGFGTSLGEVFIGTTRCKVLSWSETSITAVLEQAVPRGTYDISVRPNNGTPINLDKTFTVYGPQTVQVDAKQMAGEWAAISGNLFGTKKGKVYLATGTQQWDCPVYYWDRSVIGLYVPCVPVGTYDLVVTNDIGSAVSGSVQITSPCNTSCTYAISPASQTFPLIAATGSFAVTTADICIWSAATSDSWIAITSGTSGTGSGTVRYSVAENTQAAQRTGTITLAGQVFTVTQAGKSDAEHRLEISVKASTEDMANRYFYIEFKENVSAGTIRTLNLGAQGKSSLFIQPYINYPAGTWVLQPGTDEISYQFTAGGETSYGYKVIPTASALGSGYCNRDVGVFAMYSSFPFNVLYDPGAGFTDVYLTFDVPEGMPVYSPWMKESERVIKLKDGGVVKPSYFLSAWGNFSSTEIRNYGPHTFYMLAYNTDATNNFSLARFTYDYFMQAFAENYAFLPPANLYIVLPNNEGYLHPLGEGVGGTYMSNIVGNNWNPIFRDQEPACEGWLDYFRFMVNGSDMTVQPVHHIAHATLSGFLWKAGFNYSDWWSIEGAAVYYQINMLERIGILNIAQMKREFLSHLRCYQNVIVGSANDYPLKDFSGIPGNDYATKAIAYIKGALVYYTLNELIKDSTAGKYELIDLFKSLFTNFKYSDDGSYDNFIRRINQLTGRDFKEFFERFIYSNEPLPLTIEGNDIILNYFPPALTAPTIMTTTPLESGTVGVPYSQTLQGTGGSTPYSWSLVLGSLPPGLTLSGAGAISGTPTTANTYSFRIRVTGSDALYSEKVFSVTTVAAPLPDTTPNQFTFTDQTGVTPNTPVTSNAITVSGINAPAPISVTGGQYSINGGAYTSSSGTVSNGNTLTARVTSSGNYAATTSATLTIGGVNGVFSVTTITAPTCTYTVNASKTQFTAFGGTATASITASNASCSWTATSNVAWIDITSGASGTGSGTVQFSVETHTGASPRSGTLTVAGQTITIDQDAPATPLDTTPPTGTLNIDSGVAYTSSRAVTLNLSATDAVGVTGYYISESPSPPVASASGWIAIASTTSYSANVSYTLTGGGDGSKTVYVWYKDAAQNVSQAASKATILDTTAPTDGTLSASADDAQVALIWSGFSDPTSGIATYRLFSSTSSTPSCSGTPVYSGSGLSYTHQSLTNGTPYFYRLCATDTAGNSSSGASTSATPQGACTVPFISSQPQGQSIDSGQTAMLSVSATGTTPFAYQWYEGAKGNTTTPVGTNSSSFTTPPLTQTTSYWVRVSNSCGLADSDAAVITVIEPLALYDDFSAAHLDTTKWKWGELVREIDTTNKRLLLKYGKPNINALSDLAFRDPDSVKSIQADVTILESILSGSDQTEARLYGRWYNDGTSGTGMAGDVQAHIVIMEAASGFAAQWHVRKCNDSSCSSSTQLGFGVLPISIAKGNTYTVSIGYDASAHRFTFKVGAEQATFGPTGLPTRAGEARDKFKGLQVLSNTGYMAAAFDNVYKNGVLYDDFSASAIDGTKWFGYEVVREISGGKLRSKLRSSAADTSTQWASSDLEFPNPSTINLVQAKITPTGYENTQGAMARQRIAGFWYNDGTPGGGMAGEIAATLGIEAEPSGLVARWSLWRYSGPSGADIEYWPWGAFSKAISPGQTCTLSIGWDGTTFTFKVDDEVKTFTPPSTTIKPSNQPWKIIQTDLYGITGKAALFDVLIDDVKVDAQPAVLTVQTTGTGTVTSNPGGINCGTDCKETWPYGTPVTLTAAAGSGASFAGWTGCDTVSNNACTVAMLADRTVTAAFATAPESVSTPTTPSGPASGVVGATLSFSTGGSSSTLGHEVEYRFDWKGDGTTDLSGWGPATQSKVWAVTGTYDVRAMARCKDHTGIFSAWSGPFSVKIDPATCTYTVNASKTQFTAFGGGATASITASSACSWTATSNAAWIDITSGASGTGSGTVQFSVETHTGASPRSGTLTVAGQTITIDQDTPALTTEPDPVFRFFNTVSGTHFYTISEGEKDAILQTLPFMRYEGPAFFAYASQQSGTSPVFRFFNTVSGSHFYTISEGEKDAILQTLPQLRYEGPAYYAYSTAHPNTYAVYRFFNTITSTHFYTISEGEKDAILQTMPFMRYEGPAFYAKTGRSPFSCSFTMTSQTKSFPASGGTGSATVTTQFGCPWSASTSDAWLVITSSTSGSGSGTVNFQVVANGDTAARSGTITVANQTITINQAGFSPQTTSAVHRFFNTMAGTHFYTISEGEKDAILQTLPQLRYEGPAYYAYTTLQPNTAAVHRFFNTVTGSHFYTISEGEKDAILQTLPQLRYEGPAYYAYSAAQPNSAAVHRFFNTITSTHFYTISEGEKDAILQTMPFMHYEGAAYYAYPQS
jgi:hypothetical protein